MIKHLLYLVNVTSTNYVVLRYYMTVKSYYLPLVYTRLLQDCNAQILLPTKTEIF